MQLQTTSTCAGLLCLKTAKAGGESSWSSSVSVHNELIRIGRADLVEALAGPWSAPKNLLHHSIFSLYFLE